MAVGSRDVVVVGNGVIGLSVACELVRSDAALNVAVVGPAARAGGASLAAGAMLGCIGEVTPRLLRSKTGRSKIQMGLEAASRWPDWIAHLATDSVSPEDICMGCGTYVVLNACSTDIDDEAMSAIEEAAREYAQDVVPIDPKEVPFLNPLQNCRAMKAVFLPKEGFVDSSRLLAALEVKANASGRVAVVDDTAISLHVQGDRVSGVVLRDGRKLECGAVILAGGASSQALIDSIVALRGVIPRMLSGAGAYVITDTSNIEPKPTAVIRTPNRSFACGLHAVPRADGCLYVGATNHVRFEPKPGPTAYDVQFLIECAVSQISKDLNGSRIDRIGVGYRPVTVDGFPLIGRTPLSGLWMITGTYRDGLHLSPLLAEWIAKSVLTGAEDGCAAFRPARSPIRILSQEQAALEATRHHIAIGYEHAMNLPGGWHDDLYQMVSDRIRAIYSAIGDDIVLLPEFVPMVLESADPARTIEKLRLCILGQLAAA